MSFGEDADALDPTVRLSEKQAAKTEKLGRKVHYSPPSTLLLLRQKPGAPYTINLYKGRCKATWTREFKLPWHEAGPPNHHDDPVDSDQ